MSAKKTMGRPRIEIDLQLAEQLGKIMCSLSECAAVLAVNKSTLSQRPDFLDAWEKGKENGKTSLRRAQFQAATGGNPTMLIWLGKQYLGQKDQHSLTLNDMPSPFEVFAAAAKGEEPAWDTATKPDPKPEEEPDV